MTAHDDAVQAAAMTIHDRRCRNGSACSVREKHAAMYTYREMAEAVIAAVSPILFADAQELVGDLREKIRQRVTENAFQIRRGRNIDPTYVVAVEHIHAALAEPAPEATP